MTNAALARSGEATTMLGAAERRTRQPGKRHRAGFTLIETALATIIVGVGVLAMVSAQAAFHKKNAWSTNASIAMALGNEIREMTWNLPQRDPVTGDAFWGPEGNEVSFDDYDDLDDFDGDGGGLIFSAAFGNGPINARREVIPNMDGWSQIVRVFNVDSFDISVDPDRPDDSMLPADGTTAVMAIEVIVEFQGVHETTPQEMTRVSWIAPR
ncbi:MAG: type IV pilus modification PilV family protein [Planctomycetota bacterium]|jgi:type II secretory pathway pseudopilin PulG